MKKFIVEEAVNFRAGAMWAFGGLCKGPANTYRFLMRAVQDAEAIGSWKVWQPNSFIGAWLLDYLHGVALKASGQARTKSFVPIHNGTYVAWLQESYPKVIEHARTKLGWTSAVKLGDLVVYLGDVFFHCFGNSLGSQPQLPELPRRDQQS